MLFGSLHFRINKTYLRRYRNCTVLGSYTTSFQQCSNVEAEKLVQPKTQIF